MKHFIQMLRTAGATLFAAVLLVACSGPFDTSDQQASLNTGTVVIRTGNGAARTILPTAPGTFSRYELTLTKQGSEPVTPDAAGIDGAGVEVRLEVGEWTATVNAYRQFTMSWNAPAEYLAAKGSASLTVTAGGTNMATVTVEPVAFAEANGVKGIFSWDITLPEGLSDAELRLGDANTVNLLTTTSGSVEMDAGTYNLFITLEKDGLNAGLYEWVYIYPGLESQAAFDFGAGGGDELAFTDTVLLAGTVLVTNNSGAVVGSLTVSAYDAYQNEIGSAGVTSGAWLLSIPASSIGQPVYLKLNAGNYASLEDTHTVATLPKNGQAGIELELEFVTGAAITGLDGVLQIGETTGTIIASSNESDATVWASSNSGVATIGAYTGELTLVSAGDTTISYTVTAGNVVVSNSIPITVYGEAATLNPTYTAFSDFVGEKTSPSNQNDITAKDGTPVFSITRGAAATIDNATGVLTLVESGQVTVELKIAENSGRITWKGDSIVTVTEWTPAPVTGLAATPDHEKVTLSWTKPAGPDAGRLTGYVISYGEAQIQIDNGNTVSREITGLSNGLEYTFGVKAQYSGTVIATHESAEEFINGTPVNQSGITAIPPAIPGDAVIDLTGPGSSVLWLNGTITASVDNYEEFTGSSVDEVFTGSYSGDTWPLGDGWRQSPYIGNSQTTKTRYNFTSTGVNASLVIQLQVSSEANYDFAFVGNLDSTASMDSYYDKISGSTSTTITISVPTAGSHFVEIGYGKDGSQSSGSDCAWFMLAQYDNSITRINWYLDGVQIAAQTSALSQPARNYSLGTHGLTVIATKSDGKSYSKTVNFTIVEE